jgi:hypothetical protein
VIGWRITIDMRGGNRIHDEVHTSILGAPLLSDSIESALEHASILHAEPGEGEYQITATPVLS